jgi:hypothetical protein
MTDTRQRLVGVRPPRLFAVSVRGERSLLALSSRPWLGYNDMGRWEFTPLSYEALDYAAVSSAVVVQPASVTSCYCWPVCTRITYLLTWLGYNLSTPPINS